MAYGPFANNAQVDLGDYYRRGLEQAQQSVTQAATQAPAQAQGALSDVIARLAAMGITDLSQLVGKSDAELMQMATGAVQQQAAGTYPGGPRGLDFGYTGTGTPGNATIQNVGGAGLNPADQAYWTQKLGNKPPGAIVDTYSPEHSLAQWLEIQRRGTFLPNASGAGLTFDPAAQGQTISPQDLAVGLAYAQHRAAAAGVTPEALAAAQANLVAQLQAGNYAVGSPGYNDPAANAAVIANQKLLAVLGGGQAYTGEQLSAGNAAGGWTPQNVAAWAAGGGIPGAPPAVATPAPVSAPAPTPAPVSAPVVTQPVPGSTTSGGVTLTAAQLAARAAAVPQVQTYISNLSKVVQPTTQQSADLAMYQQRLADYQKSASLITQPTP